MIRDTIARTGHAVFNPYFQQLFTDRGRSSAFALRQHVHVVEFLNAEINALLTEYKHLDDPALTEIVRLWGAGFRQGFAHRVQDNRTAFAPFVLTCMRDHSEGWPESVQTAQQAQEDDERAAAHARITGTLHVPTRGVK